MSKGVSYCGVLVLVSKCLISPNLIRYASLLTGRLLHVKLSFPGGTVDVLTCYQHRLTSSMTCTQHREQVCEHLERALMRVPQRNLLLLTGDMNASVIPRVPWIGPAVVAPSSWHLRHHDYVGEMCERYNLCILTSWRGSGVYTHVTAQGGKSCLDMIAVRRCHSDSSSRMAGVLRKCPLLDNPSSSSHFPLGGSVPMFWKCWSSRKTPSFKRINTSQLIDDASRQSPAWQRFVHAVTQALAGIHDASSLNSSLRSLCEEFYPLQIRTPLAPYQDNTLSGIRNSKWRLWKQLLKTSGAGLGAIIRRWWIAARIRALSRISSRESKKLRRKKLAMIYSAALDAYQKNNMQSLFHQVRKLAPRTSRIKLMLRDEAGHIMSPEAEGQALYAHFSSLFRDDSAPSLAAPACSSLPFDELGLFWALRSLPMRKAVPQHCVPTCVLKFLANYLAPWLFHYLQTHWTQALPTIPVLWSSAWLTLIPKKGKNGSLVSHWRPIGLQDGLGKATLKLVALEARNSVLFQLTSFPQYAYLPGRGTQDAIAQVLYHL